MTPACHTPAQDSDATKNHHRLVQHQCVMPESSYDDFVESLNQGAASSEYTLPLNTKRISEATSTQKTKKQSVDRPTQLGITDVQRIEHSYQVMKKNLRTLLDESPSQHELNEIVHTGKTDEETRRAMLLSKAVWMAASLKSMYLDGKFAVADTILEDSVEYNSELQSVSRPSNGAMPVAVTTDDAFHAQGVPPLPPIRSPELAARVFVHKSTTNSKSYLTASELINTHNERLEFLGDSILNNVVTLIIFERFPTASEGELSRIRAQLINNNFLTEFSLLYGFDRMLKSNINEDDLRSGKQKIYADLFEAYIGALIIDREYDICDIKTWLLKLMADKLKMIAKDMKGIKEVNKDAKAELYSLIGTAAMHPQYQVIVEGDGSEIQYEIACTMNGEILGVGKAPSHKEAGLRAAMKALTNKPLLQRYGRLRANTDRNVSVISSSRRLESPQVENRFKMLDIIDLKFPLVSDGAEVVDADARNQLYAIVTKSLGPEDVPNYHVEEIDGSFRAQLSIRNHTLCTATDVSKKKALNRCATLLIRNRAALETAIAAFK